MEQDLFKRLLREKGLKVTSQRMLVLEIMAEHPGEHLTAEEIFDLARHSYPEIGLATVYRTLQVLVDLRIIDKISLDDGSARYELGQELGSSRHHHHHAICLGCRTVFYLLTVNLNYDEVKKLLKKSFAIAESFTEIPGNKREECGNYLEHDLKDAIKECKRYGELL